MERRELPDFLLEKHLLRIRKLSDDAVFDLDTGLCNETRFIAVGSHISYQYLFYL